MSESAKHGLLLLTDLPVMINLYDINYQLAYSEGDSGLLSSVAPPFTDFAYVTSMSAAFNSLAMDYYMRLNII